MRRAGLEARGPARQMRRIATTIDIAAPAHTVWRILTDFAAYPDWNPFIRRLSGELAVGGRLEVTLQPPGRRPMSFRPVVQLLEPERELRWRGRVLLPGLFDGEHAFVIHPRGGGCRLHHEETFNGLLVPLFTKMLADTEQGFLAFNVALQRRGGGRGGRRGGSGGSGGNETAVCVRLPA